MDARKLLRAYAIAAGECEDAKRRASDAELALQVAADDAVGEEGVALPVTVALDDGRLVTIDSWREEDNYTLTYTISEPLDS